MKSRKSKMSDIIKHGDGIDGFDGFEDRVQSASGETSETPRGPIQGDLISFTNEGAWIIKNNPNLPIITYELIVVDVLRIVQKWQNKRAETRVLAPGEPVPDIAQLNQSVPISEWEVGPNGQKAGPYQFAYLLYLFHEPTVRKFSYITGTTGGGIAIRELVDATKWFRKWRQGGVCPVVQLTTTQMPTRFGGRERPSFSILRWVKPNDGQSEATVLPPREAPQIALTLQPQAKTAVTEPLQTVNPPTLQEEMSDSIPF
jgi:hypothetical protein